MKIAYFWVGKKNESFEKNAKQIKLSGHTLILPTKEEIKSITERYKFGKISLDKKVYSFVSDIWRLEKVKEVNEKIIYLDGTVEIKDINQFVKFCEKDKRILFKEDRYAFASSVFMLDYKDDISKIIIDNSLEEFKNRNKFSDKKIQRKLLKFKILPNVMTKYIHKFWYKDLSWKTDAQKGIYEIKEILNFKNGINKIGKQTWSKKSVHILPSGKKTDWFGLCEWQWENKKFLSRARALEQWVKYKLFKY